jgi:hypothetical protein
VKRQIVEFSTLELKKPLESLFLHFMIFSFMMHVSNIKHALINTSQPMQDPKFCIFMALPFRTCKLTEKKRAMINNTSRSI